MDKNKKATYWLCSAHGISDIYSGFLTPIMPFIAVKLGFSIAIATMIMSISQAISSTIQPLFGYLADKYQIRFFIFWGLLLASVSNPIAANANCVWILFLFIILGTLGSSLFHPQALGLITKFSDKNSIYNMSLFVTAGTIGYAVGPIISAGIVQFFGYTNLLYTSVIGILTALLMFNCIPKLQQTNIKPIKKKIYLVFKDIFSNKIMLILFVIGMMKTLIQTICSIMMPFLWKDLGYPPIYIGFAMFLFLFSGALGSMSSHLFEEKFGAKFVFYFSLISTLPLMILYALLYKNHPSLSLVIFMLIGCFTAFAQPLTLIIAQKILPQYKSIVSGIINGLTWGVVSVLLVGLGFIAETIGIINLLLLLFSLPFLSSYFVRYLPNKIEE